jgi:membrane protein YdbS with pleckstrin-like domain
MFNRLIIVFFGVLALSAPAFGYIGPGMGAGAIGVVVALVGSVFLALFSIFYYPIKRRYKKWRGEPEAEEEAGAEAEEESSAR